ASRGSRRGERGEGSEISGRERQSSGGSALHQPASRKHPFRSFSDSPIYVASLGSRHCDLLFISSREHKSTAIRSNGKVIDLPAGTLQPPIQNRSFGPTIETPWENNVKSIVSA